MNKTVSCIALLGLLAMGGQAGAVIGTIDDVPAATLLLPYFAVDLSAPDELTTLFSINNASAAPALAHVTLWTDKSVPTLDFDLFLTGYDVITINLRDVFNGTIPQTEHVTDGDAISPVGDFSLLTNPISGVGNGAPASCNGSLPQGPIPGALVAFIRAAHTGLPSPLPGPGFGRCYGNPSDLAIGYITVDNVSSCSIQTGEDCNTGYFVAGGGGIANNINQLWGDVFYVDVANQFAQGETLVHIEASDQLGPADYTFYRRYCPAGQDQREGLASTFAVRYAVAGGGFDGTDLLVWRDSKVNNNPFTCGTLPSPYPMGQNQIVIFDEDENPDVLPPSPFSPPIIERLQPFPYEVNRTSVGGPDLPVAEQFGWLYLNLNTTVAGSQVPFEPADQNWVQAIWFAAGEFSVGFDAIQLDNVTFTGPTLVTAPGRTDICLDDNGMAGPC